MRENSDVVGDETEKLFSFHNRYNQLQLKVKPVIDDCTLRHGVQRPRPAGRFLKETDHVSFM